MLKCVHTACICMHGNQYVDYYYSFILLLQVALRNQKEFGLSQVLWSVHVYSKHTADLS